MRINVVRLNRVREYAGIYVGDFGSQFFIYFPSQHFFLQIYNFVVFSRTNGERFVT